MRRKIYLVARDGVVTVVKAGPQFENWPSQAPDQLRFSRDRRCRIYCAASTRSTQSAGEK